MPNITTRTVLILAVATIGNVHAACIGTPPVSGATVTCNDADPNPDISGVQGGAGVQNVGVTVAPAAAQIAVVNLDGVFSQAPGWSVDNAGSISATISAGIGSTVGVRLTQGGSVVNRAGGSISGVNSAVRSDVNTLQVNNAGTISAPGGGVLVTGGLLTLTNSGNISSLTATASGVRAPSGSVSNVSGATISGNNAGVLFDSSGSIDNSGTISGGGAGVEFTSGGLLINRIGGVIAAVGNGVQIVGAGNTRIENAGLLRDSNSATGGAVAFGAGDDELILQTGSQLDGNAAGGDGNDLLQLTGEGAEDAAFTTFETLRMDGSNWMLAGGLTVNTIEINSGVLRSGRSNQFVNAAASMSIDGGASYDLADFSQTLGEVQGAGAVFLGSGTLTTGALGSSTTLSGPISGSGGITKAGAGVLTLAGAATYTGTTTVTAGALRLTSSSLDGPAVVNGSLQFAQPTDVLFVGTVIGGGEVLKQGPGQLTVSGESGAFSGTTRIEAGSLNLEGNLGGNLQVQAATTLLGTGTASSLTVEGGGTLSPAGNATGVLNVSTATFDPGSIYLVQISPTGATDTLVASNAIAVQDGTLQVTVPAGAYVSGSRWRIASGSSIGGEFATVMFSNSSLGLQIEQSANAIDIVLPASVAAGPTAVPGNSTWALTSLLLTMLVSACVRLRRL
ncbi:MAG: beta strand repeat-containing protein [Lysobacterales bacterium]